MVGKKRGLIIDWMDGRHIQFDTYEEAKKEYEQMLEEYSKDGGEVDLMLLKIEKEFCNIKN
jgi:hypothetical protein